MARRGRERFEKRQREQARREKAAAKAAQKAENQEAEAETAPPDEAALLEEFRVLSERHAAEEISTEEFEEARRVIFEQLGINAD